MPETAPVGQEVLLPDIDDAAEDEPAALLAHEPEGNEEPDVEEDEEEIVEIVPPMPDEKASASSSIDAEPKKKITSLERCLALRLVYGRGPGQVPASTHGGLQKPTPVMGPNPGSRSSVQELKFWNSLMLSVAKPLAFQFHSFLWLCVRSIEGCLVLDRGGVQRKFP